MSLMFAKAAEHPSQRMVRDNRYILIQIQHITPDDETLMESVNVGQNLSPSAVVPLSERKRKRPTSASSGSGRRTRRKTTVQEYVGSDRLFTSTALKEIDDLMEVQLKHFEANSKHYEAVSTHFEDIMLGLTTLRALIVNHGALEEEVTKEWEQSR